MNQPNEKNPVRNHNISGKIEKKGRRVVQSSEIGNVLYTFELVHHALVIEVVKQKLAHTSKDVT